jgi:serine/threonine protein kinase
MSLSKPALFVALSYFIISFQALAGFTVKNDTYCATIKKSIHDDTLQKDFPTDGHNLHISYTRVSTFSEGKSGASVYKVKDIEGKIKVLKIFPTITDASNKYNYRELFYTCLNGFLTYDRLGYAGTIKLAENVIVPSSSVKAFPQLFEIGMTNISDFTQQASGKEMIFPYMVFEFIPGHSLTEYGQFADGNKDFVTFTQNESYEIYHTKQKQAATKNFSSINKQKTEAVLYQIVSILNRLQTIGISGKPYGFYHNDLNPGNVYLRSGLFSGKLGTVVLEEVPIVTLIDFGHSTSNFDGDLGSKINDPLRTLWQKHLKVISASMGAFYLSLTGNRLTKTDQFWNALTTKDGDIRLFSLEAQALAASGNIVDARFQALLASSSCGNVATCLAGSPTSLPGRLPEKNKPADVAPHKPVPALPPPVRKPLPVKPVRR